MSTQQHKPCCSDRARLAWRAAFATWRMTTRDRYCRRNGEEDGADATENLWRACGRPYLPIPGGSWCTSYQPTRRFTTWLREHREVSP